MRTIEALKNIKNTNDIPRFDSKNAIVYNKTHVKYPITTQWKDIMNITRFTLSLALLGSIVTPAVAHKDGCSHDCKHESLHPTKTTKKSTTHSEEESVTKKVEIAETKTVEIAQIIAEPVTNTTVSTPVEVAVTTPVAPSETATSTEVADATLAITVQEEVIKAADVKEQAPKIAATEDKIKQATKDLTKEETQELRLQLADLTSEELEAIEDIKALLEEDDLSLSLGDTQEADIKTAAATPDEDTQSPEAQENMNNLTQVMI